MLPIRQQPAQNQYSKYSFVLSFKSKEVLLADQQIVPLKGTKSPFKSNDS